MKDVTLEIGGMHCVMCAHAVERALNHMDGVDRPASAMLRNPLRCPLTKTGFRCGKWPNVLKRPDIRCWKTGGGPAKGIPESAHQLSDFAGAVPAFFVMMPFMFFWPDAPIMTVLHNGWLQFVLATLVQFGIGWRFFVGAWASIRAKSANMDVLVSLGTLSAYGYSLLPSLDGKPCLLF